MIFGEESSRERLAAAISTTRREGARSIATRRLPLAFLISLVAGSISGLLGLGGAILQVPALNAWCGIPLRVAAATSAVMIGVTASASAPLYYVRGDIVPPLAAAGPRRPSSAHARGCGSGRAPGSSG